MTTRSVSDDVFVPSYDIGAFRASVARYVKFLIRARWKIEPGFLTEDELIRWDLADIAVDPHPAWRLAAMAADALAVMNQDYMPLCGSGGIRETDQSTPVGRLIWNVIELVPPDGGGPSHHGVLVGVTSALKRGETVDWAAIGWQMLGTIRDDLDQLPHQGKSVAVRSQQGSRGVTGDADNVFQRRGRDWTVRFRGSWAFVLRDASGPTYIHYLLERPGRDIPVDALAAVWDRIHQADRRAPAEGSEPASRSSDDGPVLDEDTRKKCGEELEQIREELEAAEENNDVGRIAALKAERQKLAEMVARAIRPGGGAVHLGDRPRRITDRVTKAIRRTIDAIGNQNTALGAHLDSFISTGVECKYAPEIATPWET